MTFKSVSRFIMPGLLLLTLGCGSPNPDISSGKPIIYVSILPQKYFVERIAGDNFNTLAMIPAGHDPHTYAPTPRQMVALNMAKLYFRIGYIPFETTWMKNLAANARDMKIVDTSVGVELLKAEGDGHQYRYDNHTPSGIDPHIWLSPRAVKIQVKHITDAFVELDPKNRQFYETNYRRFIEDIDGLDRQIKGLLEKHRGKKFMVFHPAWTYFARDYGLVQVPIEFEGKSPGPLTVKRAVDIAKQDNIRVIFIQKQLNSVSARAVANEIKGEVVPMDPLAPDWMENMKRIAQTLNRTLR